MQTTVVTAGIALLAAAIVGGGLKAFNIEVPGLDAMSRQVLLGAFGLSLLVVGFGFLGEPIQPTEPVAGETTTTTAPTTTTTAPTTTTTVGEPDIYRTTPLTGTFNVAVVAFRSDPPDDQAARQEAENAAGDLVNFLSSELADAGNTGPALSDIDVGLYRRPSAAGDEDIDLERLALDHNADIIVTASLQSDPQGGSSFAPVFAVRSGDYERSTLLSGAYRLGRPVVFSAGFEGSAVRGKVRATLRRRSCILVHLVAGLSLYREMDYDSAATSFESAAEGTDCPSTSGNALAEGQEIAYFFLGNIEMLKLDEGAEEGFLDAAEARYDQALKVDELFSRASFGKAEVAFLRVRSACLGNEPGSSPDLEGLLRVKEEFEETLNEYQTSLEASRESLVPHLNTQARFQLARVHLCLALAQGGSTDAAQNGFQDVVLDYLNASDEFKERLTEQAAQAYAYQAFIGWRFQTSPEDLKEAVQKLDTALDLERDTDLKAVYLATRAALHRELGQSADAADDCAAIEALSGDLECPLASYDAFLNPVFVLATLAFTGSSTGPLIWIALALIVSGTVLIGFGGRYAIPRDRENY